MTTAQAARRLDVSQRQVERLVAAGELVAVRTAGDALLIEPASLAARLRDRPGVGRPWTPSTAWGALFYLSKTAAPWLSRSSAWRLGRRLMEMSGQDVVVACRRRADTHVYRTSASFLASIRERVTLTGVSAAYRGAHGFTAAADAVEGYCTADVLKALQQEFHLMSDLLGSVTLRVVPIPDPWSALTRGTPEAVVAVDLAESADPRARTAGITVLERLLDGLRHG